MLASVSAQLAADLARADTPEEVLAATLRHATSALGAYGGSVYLRHAAGLRLAAHQGYPPEFVRDWQQLDPGADVPIADTARDGVARFLDLAQTEDDYPALLRLHERPDGSIATLPLTLGEQVLGVVALSFNQDRPFGEDERHFALTLAGLCAQALGRAQSHDALRRQAERTAFLAQASEVLSASLNVQDTLAALTRLAVPRLADWCGVYLPRGDLVEAVAVYHRDPAKVEELWELVRRVPMRIGDAGGAPEIIRSGRPHLLPEVTGALLDSLKRHPEQLAWVKASGLRSGIGVPLVWNGEPIGALQLAYAESGRRFEEEDLVFAQDLARRAALALANARLYGESQAWAAQLEAKVAERTAAVQARSGALEAFSALAHDFAAERDPLRLIRRAQDIILSLLPEGVCAFFRLEDDVWRLSSLAGDLRSPTLQAALERGLRRANMPNLDVPFETRQPVYQAHFRARTLDVPAEHLAHLAASAAFPVLLGGEPVGVLVVALFGQHVWSEMNRAVLDIAVRQLELALERAQAVSALAQQNALLSERGRALQDLNEELEAFGYSISHDLRTPVRHVAGFAELLSRENLSPSGQRYTRIILDAAARMNDMIDGLLSYARVGRQDLQWQRVDLAALVHRARLDLAPDAAGRTVSWHVAALPSVRGDSAALQAVVTNLISNALKYTRGRAEAVIEIGSARLPGEQVLYVKDNGAGFDEARAAKLFGMFQRLHREGEFEGHGVGLAMVRRIVSRHGGRVWAHGTPGEGATFFVALPETVPQAQ